MSLDGTTRWRVIAGLTLGAGLLSAATGVVVLHRISPAEPHVELASLRDAEPPAVDADTESAMVAFCSDCHAMPRPESFPRDAWHREVEMGYDFYARSGRTDLQPPPMAATVAYYRSRAPQQFRFPEPVEATSLLRARFRRETLPLDPDRTLPPAIADLVWTRLEPDRRPVLLACDMRDGRVMAIDLASGERPTRQLARLNNPCHLEPCDLDANGTTDLVVADLGSYVPDDHDLGRVVWLHRDGAGLQFRERVLAAGMGRVADAQVADLDADGDKDLVVADFGLLRTGGIVILDNVTQDGSQPHFRLQPVDPRPGPIHVPVLDLNSDGRLDFLALVSQQYESVEAFVQETDGRFERRVLWTAPDLAFGSSGIEVVDLDGDGDRDILYTNGDAFDNLYANPYHGIQWLENVGGLKYAYHRLTDLTGAYRALPGDIDLDGDLDIVAAAWLPANVKPDNLSTESLPSILCLEQTEPGVFARHTLLSGMPFYVALELADFDGDGDLDFAAGTHLPRSGRATHWLALWWNQIR